MTVVVYISETERDALSRLAWAEAKNVTSVGESLRYGSIVDSVINRVAADRDRFGHSIIEVLNKPDQYSPIPKGGTWESMPVAPSAVRAIVDSHLNARLAGSPSLVGVNTHYLNPTYPGASFGWEQWGIKMTNTVVIGPDIFDADGNLRVNYNTHIFGNLFDELVPENYMLIEGAMPGTLVVVEIPTDLDLGISLRPMPRPAEQCFLAGTAISMWDGSKKPIEQIQPGDIVTSYDKDGNLKPGRVKRTMTNRARQILDVHGLMVTPGHATLCGEGRFAGRHVPIIDILRSDGALVLENGSMIRAATGCPLGSLGDRMVQAIVGEAQPSGHVRITEVGQIRLGTRFVMADGEDVSVLDLIAKGGGMVTESGMITTRPGGPEMPFRWTLSSHLPKPEDYVLQRSATHLTDIYQANEWEAVRPQMPMPVYGEAGATVSHHPAMRRAAPVNVPLSMQGHASAPKMSRKYRRAAAAKARHTLN